MAKRRFTEEDISSLLDESEDECRDSILHYNGDSEIRSELSEYETLNNNVLNERHISEDKKEI